MGKEVKTYFARYSTKANIWEHFLCSTVIVVSHEKRAREDNISKSCCAKPWSLQTQRVGHKAEARRGRGLRMGDKGINRYWMKGSMLKGERKKRKKERKTT